MLALQGVLQGFFAPRVSTILMNQEGQALVLVPRLVIFIRECLAFALLKIGHENSRLSQGVLP